MCNLYFSAILSSAKEIQNFVSQVVLVATGIISKCLLGATALLLEFFGVPAVMGSGFCSLNKSVFQFWGNYCGAERKHLGFKKYNVMYVVDNGSECLGTRCSGD